jgi:hypothetical protein
VVGVACSTVIAGLASGCVFGAAVCDSDANCPSGDVCTDGTCGPSPAGDTTGLGDGLVADIEGCTRVEVVSESFELPGQSLDGFDGECLWIDGPVEVDGRDGGVSTLGLARVRLIVGSLELRETQVDDFSGAGDLQQITQALVLRDNPSLVSFAGLDALEQIGSLALDGANPGLDQGEIDAFLESITVESGPAVVSDD